MILENISGGVVVDNDPSFSFNEGLLNKLDPEKSMTESIAYGNTPNFFEGYTLPTIELSNGDSLQARHKMGM